MAVSREIINELKKLGTKARAEASLRYFKTGKGQYGFGDVFIGVTVPQQRIVAKKYKNISLIEISKLLNNEIHECRLTALIVLTEQYRTTENKEKVVNFYLANIKRINNWDLVDGSAPYILGEYLLNRSKSVLYKLARSKNVWERRISVVSTGAFIREGHFEDCLKIVEILILDKHDLIHKACGWMLREVGKKSDVTLKKFLEKKATVMPRTMLRYAIEKFPDKERKKYLNIRTTSK